MIDSIISKLQNNDESITCVNLGGYGIENKKYLLDALKNNTQVTRIDYNGDMTCLGLDMLCEFLKNNTRITKIFINNSYFYDKEVQLLCETLKYNEYIKQVTLRFCNLELDEFGYIADMLKINTTIKYLDISRNSLSTKKLKHLCDGLKINRTVTHIELYSDSFSNKNTNSTMVLSQLFEYNTCITKINIGFTDDRIDKLLLRNKNIRKNVTRAIYYIIGVRKKDIVGAGLFGYLPKEIVKTIAFKIYETRFDLSWSKKMIKQYYVEYINIRFKNE